METGISIMHIFTFLSKIFSVNYTIYKSGVYIKQTDTEKSGKKSAGSYFGRITV